MTKHKLPSAGAGPASLPTSLPTALPTPAAPRGLRTASSLPAPINPVTSPGARAARRPHASKPGAAPVPKPRAPSSAAPPNDRLLRSVEVMALLAVSEATFYRLKRRPDFPLAIELGDGLLRFSEREMRAWIGSLSRRRARPCAR